MIAIIVSLLVLLAVAGLAVARRRGGDRDLVGTQLDALSGPAPARGAASPLDGAAPRDAANPVDPNLAGPSFAGPSLAGPSFAGHSLAGHSLAGLAPEQRRRLESLVAANRRMQAINLVREATGCPLAEAKAAIDGLGPARTAAARPPRRRLPRAGRAAPAPRDRGQFPPGFDLDPHRLHRPPTAE